MNYPSRKRGFTLIEVMIVIAIVAIIIVVTSRSISSYRWMAGETNYGSALRQAEVQKKLLEKRAFTQFPPELVTIPRDGKIKLSNENLDSKSVKVAVMENGVYSLQPASGIMSVDGEKGVVSIMDSSLAGKKALVYYEFLLPDYGEAATVPANEPYQVDVFNSPILKIQKVEEVRGSKFTVIPPDKYSFLRGAGKVKFNREYAGRPVRITYLGGMINNRCSGRFLGDDLEPANGPTALKLVKIKEDYGDKHDLEVGFLKVRK